MNLPRFAVAQCGCMDEKSQCSRKLRFQHYYLWLFLQVALPHTPPSRVLEVPINDIRGITIHIKFISAIPKTIIRHYSSIIYLSTLPTLAHAIAKGSIFSITIRINESKIQTILLFLHVAPFQPSPISLLRGHLNSIRNVTIYLNAPKNYEFHTNIGSLQLFLQNITCNYDLANGTAQNNLKRINAFL